MHVQLFNKPEIMYQKICFKFLREVYFRDIDSLWRKYGRRVRNIANI
jgi:hypothetical protein